MKALVTGSAGFVGRHMAAELERRGYEVHGLDLVGGKDCVRVFRAGNAGMYDLVAHCAFHVGGRAAIDGEPRLLAWNLQIDAALFDWAVRTKQRRVLYFSSSAAYPVDLQRAESSPLLDEDERTLHEDDIRLDWGYSGPPDGRYGWAKLTGEQLAGAARESGLPVTVVRPFSGYGEDQSRDYPFPSFVERARRREDPFVVWGPGTQVRDWIHVDDLITMSLAVVESGVDEPVNLCTGVGTSMLDLAKLCCEQVSYEPQFAPQPDKPTGVAYRVGDSSLLHKVTGLVPQVSLAEGVARALRG